MIRLRILAGLGVSLLVPGLLAATGTNIQEPGEELRVLVVVIEPGPQLLSRFGHSSIWIEDMMSGTTTAYSYGESMASRSELWPRLIGGGVPTRLLVTEATDESLDRYVLADRSVWMLELNLDPSQRVALQAFLDLDHRPTDASFRYDFYRENCTTPIRDAIDWVLGGQLWDATGEVMTGQTFRWHTRRYTASDPALHLGLTLAMGKLVDRRISMWEEMFLPMTLRDRLHGTMVTNRHGETVPLVLSEVAWYQSDQPALPDEAGHWWFGYLLGGMMLGGALGLLGAAAASSRWARAALAMIAVPWLGVLGGLGGAILGLWLFADQYVTFNNENLLLVHPLALVLVVLLMGGVFGSRWMLRASSWMGMTIVLLAVTALVLTLVPGIGQANAPILSLVVPAHFGLAYGLWCWRAQVDGNRFEHPLPFLARPTENIAKPHGHIASGSA